MSNEFMKMAEMYSTGVKPKREASLAAPSGSAYLGDTFGGGVVSMARDCKAALELVRCFRWNLDDFEHWLDAVITNDAKYLNEIIPEIMAKNTPNKVEKA